jgi:predicted  nucleic acid-binding Zn-ribbon protein
MPKHKFIRHLAVAATLIVLPLTQISPIHIGSDHAFAGNGGGNAGGNGGGNAGGNGGGNAGGPNAGGPNAASRQGEKLVGHSKTAIVRSSPKSIKAILFGKTKNQKAADVDAKPAATKRGTAKIKSNKAKVDVASVGSVKKEKTSKGALSSKLGALNAAHASPKAFANASPNSRVGLIRTYYLENVESVEAAKRAVEANEVLQKAKADIEAAKKLADAVEAAKAEIKSLNEQLVESQATLDGLIETDEGYEAALDAVNGLKEQISTLETTTLADAEKALADANVDLAALEADVEDAEKAAQQSAEEAAAAEADAIAALNAAANKTPVSDEVRDALDKLLEGKIVIEETDTAEAISSEIVVDSNL